jgi:hypothetical protein
MNDDHLDYDAPYADVMFRRPAVVNFTHVGHGYHCDLCGCIGTGMRAHVAKHAD